MPLLFVLIYKGTANDGPNDNVEQLKYCSSTLTNYGYGTLRPPNDGSYSKDWGQFVLMKPDQEVYSFKDYCSFNSCTDDGLHKISIYNGYEQEWEEISGEFDDNTTMAYKRFMALKLYAKRRNKRKYHLDPQEGGHRRDRKSVV